MDFLKKILITFCPDSILTACRLVFKPLLFHLFLSPPPILLPPSVSSTFISTRLPPESSPSFFKPSSGSIETHLLYIMRMSCICQEPNSHGHAGRRVHCPSPLILRRGKREDERVEMSNCWQREPIKERWSSAEALPQACSA